MTSTILGRRGDGLYPRANASGSRRIIPNLYVRPFVEPPDWTSAACAGMDTNLFFVAQGQSSTDARAICNTCPIKQACLEYALSHNDVHGIWGGATERQRRQMRSAKPTAPRFTPAKCGTTSGYAKGCRCALCREAHREYQAARRMRTGRR